MEASPVTQPNADGGSSRPSSKLTSSSTFLKHVTLRFGSPNFSQSSAGKKIEASPVTQPDCGSSRPSSSKRRFSSTFSKHVTLYNWWLIRTEEFSGHHNLGIGGLISDPQLGQRIFESAAISERHTGGDLQTLDGITITLVGSINRERTRQNGFSCEVCSHFRIGFPFDWEDYAGAEGSISRANSSLNSSLPKSFDDLPISSLRDFSFSPTCQVFGVCELQKIVVKNIGENDDARVVPPPKEGNSHVTSKDSEEDEISIKNSSNVDKQHQIDDTSVEEDAPVVGTQGRPSTKKRKSCVVKEGIQQEKSFPSSPIIKSPPRSESVSSTTEVPNKRRRQDGESANEKNTPTLNMKATKAATGLRKHSTGSQLGTKGTQKEEGKSVSVACIASTRQLTLRSRSIDRNIKRRPT